MSPPEKEVPMQKRKDKKGRVLRDGELQRRDGKYEYRYVDTRQQRHSVYSWKLVESDTTPCGKRDAPALRTLEEQIKKAQMLGIGGADHPNVTVGEYAAKMLALKTCVKPTTRALLERIYNNHIANELGHLPIAKVRYSDVRALYTDLLTKKKLSMSTVCNVNRVLRQVFILAVKNQVIAFDPTECTLQDIKAELRWRPQKRNALTVAQQNAFLDFVSHSPRYRKWSPLFTVLLGTGLRIGEAIALRWCDCNFQDRTIAVQHGYVRLPGPDGHVVHMITTPKTPAGIRMIPMLNDVYDALMQLRVDAMTNGFCKTRIGEYDGFIFQNSRGNIIDINYVERVLHRIAERYNEEELASAQRQKREPVLLPDLTAHILRHTFCTRLCEHEANLKVIQEVMGHESISTTMDIYTDATADKKAEVFDQLEGKIRVV